jgi:hypothetical protein
MFASFGARSIRVVYQPQQTGDQRHDCHDNAEARSKRPGCEDSDFFGEPGVRLTPGALLPDERDQPVTDFFRVSFVAF